jgi:probable phosphoglycerate mutase
VSDLWLVRHGETEWSRDGRHTGRTDLPLTEHGREQAAAVAPLLAGHEFAAVFTSPLRRARDTAALAGLDAQPLDELHELDYGDYEGVTTAEIRETVPDWSVWTYPSPGGESLEEAGARADAVIARADAAGGDVLLVSHGHFLRILAARRLQQPPAFGAHLRLDTATVSVLGHERETPVVARWNVR